MFISVIGKVVHVCNQLCTVHNFLRTRRSDHGLDRNTKFLVKLEMVTVLLARLGIKQHNGIFRKPYTLIVVK